MGPTPLRPRPELPASTIPAHPVPLGFDGRHLTQHMSAARARPGADYRRGERPERFGLVAVGRNILSSTRPSIPLHGERGALLRERSKCGGEGLELEG